MDGILALLIPLLTPYVGFPHHAILQFSVLQIHSILVLSVVQTAQVKGSVSLDCFPLQMPIASDGFPGYPRLFDLPTN